MPNAWSQFDLTNLSGGKITRYCIYYASNLIFSHEIRNVVPLNNQSNLIFSHEIRNVLPLNNQSNLIFSHEIRNVVHWITNLILYSHMN